MYRFPKICTKNSLGIEYDFSTAPTDLGTFYWPTLNKDVDRWPQPGIMAGGRGVHCAEECERETGVSL